MDWSTPKCTSIALSAKIRATETQKGGERVRKIFEDFVFDDFGSAVISFNLRCVLVDNTTLRYWQRMPHIKTKKISFTTDHRAPIRNWKLQRTVRAAKRNKTKVSTHLYAFLTAKVCAQTLYGYVYLKIKSKKNQHKKEAKKWIKNINYTNKFQK